ncbi:MAG: hypothetical protein NUV59_03830 [Patescibacteria group bacterium]|nr:hypothetical protein [Patescibacteria group bacterium]
MNKFIIIALLVAGVATLGFVFTRGSSSGTPPLGQVVIHKSASCGCCGVYATYLKREGYGVDVHNISDSDLGAKKREIGVPYELESCHTSEVGGYIVEGHIPEEAIAKLLADKPDIKGIGMPGMPMGAPGMGGSKMSDFVVYEITQDGERGDIFMTL